MTGDTTARIAGENIRDAIVEIKIDKSVWRSLEWKSRMLEIAG